MTHAPVHRHDRHFGYAMIAPAVLVILLIALFPLVWMLLVSVQNISMIDEDTSFHGLMNYQRLLTDLRFWEAIGHTLMFTAIALPLELILGLLLALLFLENLPGRPIFVALLVMPTVISPIVAGAAWRLLFDNRFGPINQVVSWFAGKPVTILWLNDPNFVYAAILIAEIWQWTPFMFLLLFASLTNVDPSLGEAARIDGAGFWRTLWSITLPVIRPVIVIALLIRGLDLFRIFDVIWALTRGGPGTRTETISIYAYVQGFQQFETSYTAAMAFVIIVILSIIVMTALKRVEIAR
ncbi:MAG TPA: sugar ABC transporter permease [Geminicoccus sp.]|jgi:multiple sugar transport system permease protein|uniref:carbohydrate ABC transporter permease n=1 Tax=Geminicoccus sp. TaxID=2024832 RepID=UPI002E2F5286|nr:sugar ABC transporter permease [Geminicoccus sp.]HEX2525934.1 sugar ABC transporter permease [Geminicoccus sp.]